MRPLGKNQLKLLRVLGCPTMFLVVECKEARSLAKRALVKARGSDGDSLFQITPDGWRALAEAVDAGRLEMPPPPKAKKEGRCVMERSSHTSE